MGVTSEQRTDIKVGVTVVLGTVILLLGIAWAKGWSPGAKEQIIQAVFPTAGGLEVGDPVMINGVRRGSVEAVDLRASDVLVSMEFPSRVDLRRDARAEITMLELMGGKRVEVLTGSSPVHLAAGTVINGSYSGDISSLVAMVTSLSGTLQSITGKADTLFASLNALFQGNDLKSNVNSTLADAKSTLGTISTTANRLNAMLAQDGPTLRRTLDQADVATRDLSQTLEENRAGLHGFIDSTGRALAEARLTLGRANQLFGRFDTLFAATTNENTLFYRLMKDKGFAAQLDSALTSITKLSDQIRFQGLDANIRLFNSSKPVR